MQITISSINEDGIAVLPPDLIWNGFTGDFVVATVPAEGGVGGFVARNPIQTAVLMLLFTDVRVDPSELTFAQRGDCRGWVGDGFDVDTAIGEQPLGSKLWLFRRAIANAKTAAAIAAEARRALQPLIVQGVVVRIDASTELLAAENQIRLAVALYGRDGTQVYAAKFDALWKRVGGL